MAKKPMVHRNKSKQKPRRQTRRTGPFAAWIHQQQNAIRFSLKRLWFTPVSTWITLAAIAIALSLPTSLNVLLDNMQSLTDDKREVPTITLFLKGHISEQQAKDRAELLEELPEVTLVKVVTRDEAIEDFKKITGFKEMLEAIPEQETPFPHVLIVTPNLNLINKQDPNLVILSEKFRSYPEVDKVQADTEWIRRLRAILQIADRIVLVVSILLGMTVLLVIGNTIRLDIENRKEEITVTRLIGATNAYIRRPFIYGGLWLGVFGGVISLVIVHIALLFLIDPVDDLAKEYSAQFTLSGVSLTMTLQVLLISALLGIVGAWLAVSRFLWKSEATDETTD